MVGKTVIKKVNTKINARNAGLSLPSMVANCLYWGWLLFPMMGFLLPSVTLWKNYFYVGVLLPWLLLLFLNQYRSDIHSNVIGRLMKTPILIASLALILYLALSTLWSPLETKYIGFYLKQVVYIVCYLSAGLMIAQRDDFSIDKVLNFLCVGAGICLLISIVLYFTQEPPHGLTKLGLPNRFWGYGMVENSLAFAQHFGGVCLISLYLLRKNYTAGFALYVGFFGLLCIVSFITVLATMSRGASVFLIAALVLLLVHYARNNRIIQRVTLFFVGIAVICLLLVIFSETVRDAIFSEKRDLFSIDRRLDIWHLVIAQIKENLIIGIGARKHLDIDVGYLVFHHSHSTLLETILYGGLVALAIWVCQLLFILKIAIKHPLFLSWLMFCLLCLMINGHYLLSRPGWQWMIYWIPIALLMAFNESKKNSIVQP